MMQRPTPAVLFLLLAIRGIMAVTILIAMGEALLAISKAEPVGAPRLTDLAPTIVSTGVLCSSIGLEIAIWRAHRRGKACRKRSEKDGIGRT